MIRQFLLLASLTTIFVCAQTTLPSQPFTITISGPPGEVKTGTAVELKIRLTNTSQSDIGAPAVYSNGINLAYKYDVREGGIGPVEKVSPSTAGKVIQSLMTRTLKPQESAEDRIAISRNYKMDLPGQYEIQISRTVSAGPKSDVVRSNVITINVVP